jgi:hypothetical protein
MKAFWAEGESYRWVVDPLLGAPALHVPVERVVIGTLKKTEGDGEDMDVDFQSS